MREWADNRRDNGRSEAFQRHLDAAAAERRGGSLDRMFAAFQQAKRAHPNASAFIRSGKTFIPEAATKHGAKAYAIPASVKTVGQFELALTKVDIALAR